MELQSNRLVIKQKNEDFNWCRKGYNQCNLKYVIKSEGYEILRFTSEIRNNGLETLKHKDREYECFTSKVKMHNLLL